MRGTRRYLLRCQEPPGSAGNGGKVRYLRIKRPWLFVWHKICVGTRRPRGRVSAATPSACSAAVCGRRCADSRLRMVLTMRSSVKIRTKTHVSLRLRLTACACAVNELRASLRGHLRAFRRCVPSACRWAGSLAGGMGTCFVFMLPRSVA